ncbi:MAG: reverse transcriptase domain-containing protein, partial [Opitutales bacterium]
MEVYGEDIEDILLKIHSHNLPDGEDRTPGWSPADWDTFVQELEDERLQTVPVYSIREDSTYTARDCHDRTVCAMIAGEITGARVTPAVPMTKERGIPPPANRRQAQKCKEWPYYYKAEVEEYKTHDQNNTWDLTPPGKVPRDARVLPTKWAYDDKLDDAGNVVGAKARLCARGDRQIYGVDYFETFSAVMNIRTFRMCLAILNLYACLSMEHWDIKAAFINAPLEEELYIRQPEGHVIPGKENWLCKLNKALYGACQASRAWFKYLAGLLADAGMEPLKSDPATYIIREG